MKIKFDMGYVNIGYPRNKDVRHIFNTQSKKEDRKMLNKMKSLSNL